MKSVAKALVAAAGLAVVFTGSAVADGHLEGAIKARQAEMTLNAFNIGILGAMAKGEAPYDAEAAAAAANNLAALANLAGAAMWPAGSDNAAFPDKTRALPELWSTFPAVLEKSKALSEATANLAKVAGTDLASLQGAIGPVGAACGGCHKPYRAEKK